MQSTRHEVTGGIAGSLCWSLLLADLWPGQPGEWKAMLPSPHTTFIPATMATFFMAHGALTEMAGEGG